MTLTCKWNQKMNFIAEADGHQLSMDAKSPIGDGTAMTPKQLLLAAISGCTAMDVIALLKKYRQNVESLEVDVSSEVSENGSYPVIFKAINLLFKLKGPIDPSKALEAINLSQTKYCGVSAMVSKSVPISYTIELNGENIGSGYADFK